MPSGRRSIYFVLLQEADNMIIAVTSADLNELATGTAQKKYHWLWCKSMPLLLQALVVSKPSTKQLQHSCDHWSHTEEQKLLLIQMMTPYRTAAIGCRRRFWEKKITVLTVDDDSDASNKERREPYQADPVLASFSSTWLNVLEEEKKESSLAENFGDLVSNLDRCTCGYGSVDYSVEEGLIGLACRRWMNRCYIVPPCLYKSSWLLKENCYIRMRLCFFYIAVTY